MCAAAAWRDGSSRRHNSYLYIGREKIYDASVRYWYIHLRNHILILDQVFNSDCWLLWRQGRSVYLKILTSIKKVEEQLLPGYINLV